MNTAYYFLPFKTDNNTGFKETVTALRSSGKWELIHDDIKYLFKYVSDKLNSYDEENCHCFHFSLNKESISEIQVGENAVLYETKPHPYKDADRSIVFRIIDVQLFCFSSGVNFIAFRIQMTDDDPLWIANAAYYLKKPGREFFHSQDDPNKELNFLLAAEALVAELYKPSFFFYSNAGTERSNMMIFASHSSANDCEKELYYLKYCYHDTFPYTESPDGHNDFPLLSDRAWGISHEALVCLLQPNNINDKFLDNQFFNNFNTQYLFLYVLLLHRRAVLYMFLTEISENNNNNIELLKDYKERLYEYETNFEYSSITEVPQHQGLYNKILEVFALDSMFKDVREPLISLSDLQEKEKEHERQRSEKKLNAVLLILGVLSIFSALVDSFDFFAEYTRIGQMPLVNSIPQGISIAVIIVILLYIIKILCSKKKE